MGENRLIQNKCFFKSTLFSPLELIRYDTDFILYSEPVRYSVRLKYKHCFNYRGRQVEIKRGIAPLGLKSLGQSDLQEESLLLSLRFKQSWLSGVCFHPISDIVVHIRKNYCILQNSAEKWFFSSTQCRQYFRFFMPWFLQSKHRN